MKNSDSPAHDDVGAGATEPATVSQGRRTERRRVVLLHAALGDSRLWAKQVEALAPRFDIVAPDLPGWGNEPMPSDPFSFVGHVEPLLPASLVGNSFGGRVALQAALAHRDAVDRLVLVAPALPGWEFGEEMQSYFAAEEEALDANDLDRATEINLSFWVPPALHEFVRPLQRRAFELQTAHPAPAVRWPPSVPLSSLRIPTLIVVGERDRQDFRAMARHAAIEIPHATLVEVPDAGHLLGLEQPERLNALLIDFLTA